MFEVNLIGRKKPKKRANNNLLMHFDGVPGSTTFKDEYTGNGNVLSLGNPKLTGEQSKFGNSSGKFLNESLKLELPIVLAGDYTVSGWLRLLGYPTSSTVLSLACDETAPGQPTFIPISILASGASYYICRWISSINPNPLALAPIALPLNVWGHFATTRQGNTYRNFFNGKLVQELTIDIPKNNKITHLLHHNGVTSRLNGYADEIEVLDGTAKYLADFTPPTAPFTI